jgi:glyoxylate reductase
MTSHIDSARAIPADDATPGRWRIAVARRSLPGHAVERLAAIADINWWTRDEAPTADELRELCADCDAALVMAQNRVDGSFLAGCPRLRWIVTVSAGYENLDLDEIERRGVMAANVPGVLAEAVADATWGLMLAASRRIVEGDRYIRDGEWQRVDIDVMVGWDVYGKTLGIVGFGQVGEAVARRASGFSMTVQHTSRQQRETEHSTWVPLDELLTTSDIVAVTVSLNPSSVRLIAERELSLMKPTAILVNTSRGQVVDQAALAERLRTGRLRAAALDVFEQEPIGPDHPLLNVPNLIVTPHLASGSVRTRERTVDSAVASLESALAGGPLLNSLTRASSSGL